MEIRRAGIKDIDGLLKLLHQVLEIHAAIRPDIFIPGTTKYTHDELEGMVGDDRNPIYVAVDDSDEVTGYAFCQLKEPKFATTMVQFKTLFIDDLCVDSSVRGQNIGRKLFEYVKDEASRLGCYDITLNVWTGNDSAESFYEKMGMKTRERQLEYIL